MTVMMNSGDNPELSGHTEDSLDQPRVTPEDEIGHVYELDRCEQWINSRGLKRVSLQFPDSLLQEQIDCHLCQALIKIKG